MGDFIQNTAVKTATRTLATPIPDVATFQTIVNSVVSANPFGCVSYISAGITHAPVEKTKESYVAKIVYQDEDAKVVGSQSGKFDTVAGFNAGATALLTNAALTTAHGGTPARDSDTETYSATLKCSDPNGEYPHDHVWPGPGQPHLGPGRRNPDQGQTWADTVAALARGDTDGQRTHHCRGIPRRRAARLCDHPRPHGHLGPGARPHGVVRKKAGVLPCPCHLLYFFRGSRETRTPR